ncbi:HAMP domain-containing sensor histidine kinase [Actinoplanes sp. NBRC 103695]|uniref:sensor histidine kinase n=1 Tax=Actinoplanes sp. NBRC 103695 TaxID=3032202 RepID=UPI0024A219E2|nr:HAMP domain-containing sensor histidine kinase [Actinoplanes sp. NBRC 103695]GLY96202.1 sensor histidine kinase [Actinoplanes sp. NBRC 103695]
MTAIVHPSRWRSPRGWSLRTRLVAILIVLLAALGLLVGATAQIFLHKTLYDRVDDRLTDATSRTLGRPPGSNRSFFRSLNPIKESPPGGSQTGSIIVIWGSNPETGAPGVFGGEVQYTQPTTDETFDPRDAGGYAELPTSAVSTLAALAPNGEHVEVDLGGDRGDYLVSSNFVENEVVVTGLPLGETQSTLLQVGLVIGGGILLSLVAAGLAGAYIVRRTLKPLDRVAATATRVSELRLDRGEVELAQRVPAADTDSRTEVGQVGAALNQLLDHVGSALEARHNSEMQVRQFVADASHELRTPLAAIRGYAELSRRSRQPIPEEVGHVLRRVESEALRMTALVEDLLLLARLDAGRPLEHEPVDLTMLVVDAVSDAHAAGPRHDWQLALPEEPVAVIGDGARLHQVLANLLANARTHTPEGTTVTVGVRATDHEALLTVTDRGPGIPAELQPHIFKRFARGDSSRSRAAGSTGLGLSIVYAVVTAHGGTVAVESAPGRTEFTVRLPLSVSPGAAYPVHQDVAQVVQ